jgi:glycosyltransferase involved in cell wall biosynthesis
MTDTIIFSFDRAMQLSILLESLVQYDVSRCLRVHVLFSCSSAEYKAGYERLIRQYPQFNWMEESVFSKSDRAIDFDLLYWRNLGRWMRRPHLRKHKSNFKQLILHTLNRSQNEAVLFLTDDSLFYRNISLPKLPDKQTVFSLRHGANLDGGNYHTTSAGIEWDIYENNEDTDWGYPFSIDGHVYNRETLAEIFQKIIFNSPNTLEGHIAHYCKQKHLFAHAIAHRESCLVGFELNRVQSIFPNHHLGISQEQLNRYFLDGYRLTIDFDASQVDSFRPAIRSVGVEKDNEVLTIYSTINKDISFSIVTPVFNRQDCIERCIESVVNQKDPDVEHWIVDDGSTDDTPLLIERYAIRHPSIHFHRFERNRGVNAARNHAIQRCTKQFVLFLDSDDYFTPHAFRSIRATIATHPGYLHYLFAQNDRISYYRQNPLLFNAITEISFGDFLAGKVDGDFLHAMATPLIQAFPFDESLRTYEGLTFLSIYKEGGKQFFSNQILVLRERGRADSVSNEYLLQTTDALDKQIHYLKLQLSLFEADYRRLGATKALRALRRRIRVLALALRFGPILQPVLFAYSRFKQKLK